MIADNTSHYGTISRLLHWLMAAGFAVMLFTAAAWFLFEDAEWTRALFPIHKSFGFLLTVLLAIRIVWALVNRNRRPPADSMAARLGHLAIYAMMITVPAIGLIRQYGMGRGSLEVFGLKVMPGSPEKIEWMANLGNMFHGKAGWILFALAAGHIAMVIIHRLRGHNVLPRMLGK